MTWHPDVPPAWRDEIMTGDARLLATGLPDQSIDLAYCDPVYDRADDYRWLAETACRVLKPEAALLCFCGIGYQEKTQAALRAGGRPVRWILPVVYRDGNTPRFHRLGFAKWAMLLWAGGEPVAHFCDVQVSAREDPESGHVWTKNKRPLAAYLRAFSRPGAVVWDPFSGGGTIPRVCAENGRHFIASELDPEIAARARERVRLAPPPLLLESAAQQAELVW